MAKATDGDFVVVTCDMAIKHLLDKKAPLSGRVENLELMMKGMPKEWLADFVGQLQKMLGSKAGDVVPIDPEITRLALVVTIAVKDFVDQDLRFFPCPFKEGSP